MISFLGRSEASLEPYLQRLEGKADVRVACMDLATHYLDPAGARNRGLRSLMRRHRHNLKPEQQVKLAEYFQADTVLGQLSLQIETLLPAVEETQNASNPRT